MEVRPGYKRTEVGIIPEDWAVCRLDSLGIGQTPPIKAGPFGSALTKDTYVPTGYKVYGQEQVIRGDHLFGDYFITQKKYRELEACAVRPGDVLLSLVGTAGRLLEVPANAPPGIINPRLIRFSFDNSRVNPTFFRLLLESGHVQSLLERQAQGGTMGVLNAGVLRPFCIQLPPITEQRAIAAALSDVGALLEGLMRLIAKKRDLKQAAMEQLLTGQTRLPGFHGEWETSTVGREFDVALGKMLDVEKNAGISKPYLGNRDVQWGRIKIDELRTVRMTPPELERYRLLKGDLLVCEGGEVGRAAIWNAPLDECYYQKALHRLRSRRGMSAHFMAATLELWARRGILEDYVTQTSIAHLPRERFVAMPILVPEIAEQAAIAAVLSDMDAELSALEARRDKTRALKQAMMQELLTGRTRLV